MLLFALSLLFLALSAFFSASETAFSSLSAPSLAALKKRGTRGAALVEKLKSKNETLLATILIGNNLANNFFSSIAAMLAMAFFPRFGASLAAVASSVIVIFFAEILPKTAAIYMCEKFAPAFAAPIRALQIALFPAIAVFEQMAKALKKLFVPKNAPYMTKDELKIVLEKAFDEKTIDFNEKIMLEKIMFFDDLRIKSISAHSIFCLDEKCRFDEAREAFCKTGFSRIPIAKDGNPAEISGVLYWRDLLFYGKPRRFFSAKKCARPPFFVPESKGAASLFYAFRREQEEFAVAINEHGEVSGIVTLNDILRSALAKTDATKKRFFLENDGSIVAEGEIPLQELESQAGISLKSEFFNTLAGFFLEKSGKSPKIFDKIEGNGCIFVLEKVFRNKIERIRIIKKQKSANC